MATVLTLLRSPVEDLHVAMEMILQRLIMMQNNNKTTHEDKP